MKTPMQKYWEWRMDNAETIGDAWFSFKSAIMYIINRRKKWLRVATKWRSIEK